MMKSNYKLLFILMFSFTFVACDNSNSVATVNGQKISQSDFDAYLKYKRISIRNDEHRERILEQYLERLALAATIEDESSFYDAPELQAELKEIRKDILINKYMDQFLKDKVTDQAMLDYYNSNIDKYEDKQVQVAHILIRTERNMENTERRSKLTIIQEAQAKLNAGEDFVDVAKKYSEDAVSAKRGGDLGWIKQGTIDKAFSDQAFSLEKDSVSEPFETSFGFHIIKSLAEPKVVRKPFENSKGDIRYKLREQFRSAELAKLKENSTIKIFDK